jgi:hypothetical protein
LQFGLLLVALDYYPYQNMKTNDKILKSRLILSQFTLGGFAFEKYFAEVKLRRRWREIGGPFFDRKKADDFARQYSGDHILDTRVIIKDE